MWYNVYGKSIRICSVTNIGQNNQNFLCLFSILTENKKLKLLKKVVLTKGGSPMKIIYLPYAIEKIVKALSYIAVFILDIFNFILTPITWVKFKAHVFMGFIAGVYYIYSGLILQQENAHLVAIGAFVLISLCVALIKIVRKKSIKLRHSLMRIFYSPLGIYFYANPIFQCQRNRNCVNFTKRVSLD